MDRISVPYFRSLMHRYYTPYYYYPKDCEDPVSEQHLVSLHTNKLFLLSLGPSHIVRRDNLIVTEVVVSRPPEDIRGKKKNGAEKARPHETICTLRCADGRDFKIRAGVSGRVLEVNEQLLTNPNLIKNPAEGFVCILLTQLSRVQDELKPLEKADPMLAFHSAEVQV